MEDELRSALAGSLGQQRAAEIAREVAPSLERHPLLGVLGPSGVVSSAVPAITFLAQSSPNASAKEIAKDWQKAQAGSGGQSKKEPKRKGWQFWKR